MNKSVFISKQAKAQFLKVLEKELKKNSSNYNLFKSY